MLLLTALPFAISAMFTKMYTYTDRYMLLWLAGQRYVGWYVIANKMTYAFEFIPSAFSASIFPAMSAFYLSSKIELARTFEKAMRYLIILAIPMSFGIFVLADSLILRLYGPDFITAAMPLRIMISGLIVVFLNFPVGAFLNACNRQTTNTINMIITVIINISLNSFLIKRYTFNGAAASALISGIILFFLGLYWVGKIVPYDKKNLLMLLGKTVVGGLVMAAVLWLVKDRASLFISIPIGVIIYGFMTYLLKIITRSDIRTILHIFSKKT
jgi:O-antigen/teichoic acid export membrane protein